MTAPRTLVAALITAMVTAQVTIMILAAVIFAPRPAAADYRLPDFIK
ncbi:MAG: hypothetical protein VW268_12360 [Rhodospirillaceae bacterium]